MHDDKTLERNKADFAASTAKSIFGAAPFVGTALSELVSNLIPNQRIERLTKFVAELDARLSLLSVNALKIC